MNKDQVEISKNIRELLKILSRKQRFSWRVEFVDGNYQIRNILSSVPVQILGSEIESAKSNLRWLRGLED